MTRSSESFSLAMSVYQKHWNSFYLLLVTLIMDMWTRFQWTLSIAWGYWVSLTADTLPSEGSCGKLLLAENLVVIAHNYTQWIITMTKGFIQNVVYGLSSYIKIPIAAKMGRIVARSMDRISERYSVEPNHRGRLLTECSCREGGVQSQRIHGYHSPDKCLLCQAWALIRYYKNRKRWRTDLHVYALHPYAISLRAVSNLRSFWRIFSYYHDKYYTKLRSYNQVPAISGPVIPNHAASSSPFNYLMSVGQFDFQDFLPTSPSQRKFPQTMYTHQLSLLINVRKACPKIKNSSKICRHFLKTFHMTLKRRLPILVLVNPPVHLEGVENYDYLWTSVL